MFSRILLDAWTSQHALNLHINIASLNEYDFFIGAFSFLQMSTYIQVFAIRNASEIYDFA